MHFLLDLEIFNPFGFNHCKMVNNAYNLTALFLPCSDPPGKRLCLHLRKPMLLNFSSLCGCYCSDVHGSCTFYWSAYMQLDIMFFRGVVCGAKNHVRDARKSTWWSWISAWNWTCDLVYKEMCPTTKPHSHDFEITF